MDASSEPSGSSWQPDASAPTGVTLRAVAERAGVSLKTASRVMNGEPHVRDVLRERVFAAAEALNFRPNAAASMLGRGLGSAFLGLILSDIENQFAGSIAKGVSAVARERGVQVMIANTDDDADLESSVIADMVLRHPAGIVLMSAARSHADLLPVIRRGVRLVFVDRPPVGLVAPTVVSENREATRKAVERLIARGHRRIAFVGEYEWPATHADRFQGFLDAMRAAKLDPGQQYLRAQVHGIERARDVVRDVLALDSPPTALFTANNSTTMGALIALQSMEDRPAVIGFDDFDLAPILDTTVVRQDPVELGRLSAELVFAAATDAQRRVLVPELVTRGSDTPIRAH